MNLINFVNLMKLIKLMEFKGGLRKELMKFACDCTRRVCRCGPVVLLRPTSKENRRKGENGKERKRARRRLFGMKMLLCRRDEKEEKTTTTCRMWYETRKMKDNVYLIDNHRKDSEL